MTEGCTWLASASDSGKSHFKIWGFCLHWSAKTSSVWLVWRQTCQTCQTLPDCHNWYGDIMRGSRRHKSFMPQKLILISDSGKFSGNIDCFWLKCMYRKFASSSFRQFTTRNPIFGVVNTLAANSLLNWQVLYRGLKKGSSHHPDRLQHNHTFFRT